MFCVECGSEVPKYETSQTSRVFINRYLIWLVEDRRLILVILPFFQSKYNKVSLKNH